jgi:hypothetical protein
VSNVTLTLQRSMQVKAVRGLNGFRQGCNGCNGWVCGTGSRSCSAGRLRHRLSHRLCHCVLRMVSTVPLLSTGMACSRFTAHSC